MARDYAQRGPRRSQTQQRGQLPSWAWLVFGLSMGLAVAAFVYISRPAGSLQDMASSTPPPKPVTPPAPVAGKNGRLPLPPAEKERFSFYEALKKQKVYIPRDDRPPPTKAPAASAPELFLVQVASYRAVSDAENEKAKLALLGIESRIEKVTVDDRETYFRVRIGPLGEDRTQATLARLSENGMHGMVVKAP